MLPLKIRVKKDAFPEIMKVGIFVHTTNFYLRYIDRKDQKPALFSFVVPNKVKKTSVGRHLIKRRMTAVVEKLLITFKPGFSIIIFAKKDVSSEPYGDTERQIIELLKKVGVLI